MQVVDHSFLRPSNCSFHSSFLVVHSPLHLPVEHFLALPVDPSVVLVPSIVVLSGTLIDSAVLL